MVFGGLSGSGIALLVLACAGALALLHILHTRPREVRVITTLFWAEAMESARARSLWRRLRHPWTYMLLLLICVLVALALGEPEPGEDSSSRIWQVLVIDAGASMSAPLGDGTESRLDAAVEAAIEESKRLSWRDRLAVIVADPVPRLVQDFDEPITLAPRRLQALTASTAPSILGAGLDLAASLLRGRENACVTLIAGGDGRFRPRHDSQEYELSVISVGAPADNAALLDAIFLPAEANPLRGRLLVRAGYWGQAATDITLRVLRQGGQPLLEQQATVRPGDTHDFFVDDLAADGDHLIVRLAPSDGVPADNVADVGLPYRRAIRIHVTDEPPLVLRACLENDPAVQFVDAEADADIDLIVGGSAEDKGKPVIQVVTEGPAVAAGSVVSVVDRQLAMRTEPPVLLTCGAGVALDEAEGPGDILLASGNAILAALAEGPAPSRLRLSSALLAPDGEFGHRPEFAMFLTQSVRRLAGWRPSPLAVSAKRHLEDPVWLVRLGTENVANVVPGDRDTSDLSRPFDARERTAPRRPWRGTMAPFEWLLLAAVVLLVIQIGLHSRGRIP
jgi:hypothetical protein